MGILPTATVKARPKAAEAMPRLWQVDESSHRQTG